MSLRNRLYAGFCAFMLLLFVMYVLSFNLVSDLNRQLAETGRIRHESRHLADAVRAELLELSRLLRDPAFRLLDETEMEDQFAMHRKRTLTALETLKWHDPYLESRPMLVEMEVHLADYEDHAHAVLQAIQDGGQERLARMLVAEDESLGRLMGHIRNYVDYVDAEMADVNARTERQLQIARLSVLLLFFLIVALSGAAVVFLIRKVFDSLGSIVSVMNNMALGSEESIQRLQVNSDDELGAVATAYNRLADTLERHIRYERSYQNEIEEQNWVKTTIAEISTMYQGVQDVETLASRLLGKLAPLLGASYGAFYLTEDPETGGEGDRLRRLAVYAGNGPLEAEAVFRFGEGLIGQCALERQTIVLKDLDSSHLIRSALLEAKPAEVIIVPVEYEDRVLAVLEFATLSSFNPLHQLLLQQVVNNSGITILSVLGQMRVQKLLQDSQALTEELQSQSKELQQQQSELLRINEELEEQYRSAELRSLELQSIKAELEEKARLLEQNSRYRTEFLANMSHELRTPLNSLLILTKILYDNEEGRLSDKQVEYAGAIYSSAQQLLELINDILDLSKTESGKMNVQREAVAIDELLGFAERMFKPLAHQKNLAFTIRKSGNVPDKIESDSQRILQVMSNLLSNAIKFTERGEIGLDVSIATGGGQDEGGMLVISVRDTGIGIPEDKQEIVFEAFQQADGTTNRKFGGTGLGLSISRNIAELLGGYIRLESREGEGSVFSLHLPLDQSAVPAGVGNFAAIEPEAAATLLEPQEKEIEPLADLADASVLVIDDEVRNVYALIALLEAYRLNVLYAESVQTGLAHLTHRPDIGLVLMDSTIAGRHAQEVIREIRALPERGDLPIVVMVEQRSAEETAGWKQAGASDVLEKPVTLNRALDVVRTWLARDDA